jgi:threonine dehydrogenase-like Zn-dependent dehydrogenase
VRALTFHGPRSVVAERVPDARLESPGDAVVRVALAGICGSDLHVYHGREVGLDPGTVLGHEFVGEVVEIGAGVRSLRPGDRILSPFSTCCGDCFYCRGGLTARCEAGGLFGWVQDGVGLQGAQAELVRVPLADTTLVRVPEGVSDEEALLLGDVLPTGAFCARMAGVREGGSYAVIGCGPVGLMAAVAAREMEAGTVHAIDSVPERLALAARFGARAIDARSEDPVEVVRSATAGRGADAVLEAVGSPEATRLAIDLVRPGGTIAIVGVHCEPAFPFSPSRAYDLNLTLRVGRCPARAILGDLVPWVTARRHDLAAVISHRLPLDDGPRGYAIFDRKEDGCTKVVLRPGS